MKLKEIVPRRAHSPAASRLQQPIGVLHRYAVALVAGAVILAIGSVGGWSLVKALTPEKTDEDISQSLSTLQPWLPGALVEIPSGAGVWQWRQGATEWLAVRARQEGESARVSLCPVQMNRSHLLAGKIYDLAIGAGLASPVVQRYGAYQPVVLSNQWIDLLPQLKVSGQIVDGAGLYLDILPAAAAKGVDPQHWSSFGLAWMGSDSNDRQSVSRKLDLQQPAWVLFGAPAGVAQTGTGRARYAHALRVRWIRGPAAGTCSGQGDIEVTLFSVPGSTPGDQAGKARVTVRHRQDPAEIRLNLMAGQFRVPKTQRLKLEDELLFESALSEGAISPSADHRLQLMPPEGPARGSGASHQGSMALKSLYRSVNGKFVLQQVGRLNASQFWLALRVPANSVGEIKDSPELFGRAQTAEELLEVQPGLPGVATRLEAGANPNWGDWQRILPPRAWLLGNKSPDTRVRFSLNVPPKGLDVQVLGRVMAVENGVIRARRPACDGPACASTNQIEQISLLPADGRKAAKVTLILAPDPLFTALRPESLLDLNIRRDQQGAWRWQPDAPTEPGVVPRSAQEGQAARVSLYSHEGQALYSADRPTDLTRRLGLGAVIGLGAGHRQSLAGNLARLGAMGASDVRATTTISAPLQSLLQDILTCQAQKGGSWDAVRRQCRPSTTRASLPDRRSDAVLMNARTGAILALAQGTPPSARTSLRYLLDFDAFNRSRSPLLVGAVHQSGDATHAAGSVMKILDALALESAAANGQTWLRPLLAGVRPESLEQTAQARGKDLRMDSKCYPSSCPVGHHVSNFGGKPTGSYAVDGVLGLRAALKASSNTWFAFMAESLDATVGMGRIQARPLGQDALKSERPLQALAQRWGFTTALRLDGGLLADRMVLGPGDVLRADASQFDPLQDAAQVRLQGIGLRMQTTALHMARMAAGVATGTLPQPRLLESLNGVNASDGPRQALALDLQRLRGGMRDVVQSEGGTAHSVFKDPALGEVRSLVFGKTGSAPMASGADDSECAKAFERGQDPLACLKNAWFVGYLMPGAVPGLGDPVSFAVRISHARETGGKMAAPVIADLLASLGRSRRLP